MGRAAIVQAHRFIFDSRDEGTDERLEVLGERDGVWAGQGYGDDRNKSALSVAVDTEMCAILLGWVLWSSRSQRRSGIQLIKKGH